jgi:hypothetical protein
MIFPGRRRGKEKSNNFAAEIHSRNGLILFHGDFSGERSGGIPGRFFNAPAQLDDTTGATRCHPPENQSIHRLFFSTLPFITKIQ